MICELGPCCWRIIAHSDELRTGIGTRPISTSSASAADVRLRQNRETESSKSLFFMAFRIYPITRSGKAARRDGFSLIHCLSLLIFQLTYGTEFSSGRTHEKDLSLHPHCGDWFWRRSIPGRNEGGCGGPVPGL